MQIEKGCPEQNIKCNFLKEDKIEIKSQYGITKIYINDKELNFLTKIKFTQDLEQMPKLEIRKLITLEETEEAISNLEKNK